MKTYEYLFILIRYVCDYDYVSICMCFCVCECVSIYCVCGNRAACSGILYTDFSKFNSSDSTMARINLNYSEEVFLQRSLREVVLIWNRGTGQADFNLRVRNGMAELHLGFQLGHPRDPHFIQPKRNPSKPKGPKQKERDRKRAAAYQARAFESQESGDGSAVSANSLNPEASSESSMASLNTSQTLPSASSSLSSSTEPADVISPLSTTLSVVDPSPTTSIASVDLSFLPPAASVDTSPPNLATSQVVPDGGQFRKSIKQKLQK